MELVIYQSNYGHTKQYAEWICQALSCPSHPLDQMAQADIEAVDTIIFGSSVIAGNYKGINRFVEIIKEYPNKHFIFFGVSIANPDNEDSQNYLEEALARGLDDSVRHQVKVFLFRGGMDYSKLNFLHKAMMWMMVRMLKKKEVKSEEDIAMIENYGKKVDYSNPIYIQPLVDYVINLRE